MHKWWTGLPKLNTLFTTWNTVRSKHFSVHPLRNVWRNLVEQRWARIEGSRKSAVQIDAPRCSGLLHAIAFQSIHSDLLRGEWKHYMTFKSPRNVHYATASRHFDMRVAQPCSQSPASVLLSAATPHLQKACSLKISM